MVKLSSGFHTRGGDKLIIRLPDSRVLSVIAKSILLAFAIFTFPWFGSTILGTTSANPSSSSSSDATSMLPTLFNDLTTEGVLKSSDNALFVDNGRTTPSSQIFNKYNQMSLIGESDLERQSSIPDETFDFVFNSGFRLSDFIDRTVKTGGIVVTIRLSDNPSNTFKRPTNYKIVYTRRFESTTIVAMKKTQSSSSSFHEDEATITSNTNRKLLEFVSEAKKKALNGLEGVLLEPPRASSEKLRTKYLKRTKYLPDITGDSLDGYPRRVFIDVGSPGSTGGGTVWFEKNYPRRTRDFKKYQIETVSSEEEMVVKGKKEIPQIGMSEWLRKNVKEEEYVVMKAEAEVVEEMVSGKSIGLVDELFMECKYQGLKGEKSRRAYWECLALYGRLRDEGVAVHQWWGS